MSTAEPLVVANLAICMSRGETGGALERKPLVPDSLCIDSHYLACWNNDLADRSG